MKFTAAAMAALGLVGAAGAASASDVVEIKNAAARVVVIPEQRADVVYQVIPGRANLPAITEHHTLDGKLVLDGGLGKTFWGIGINNCSRHGDHPRDAVITVTHPPAGLTVSVNGHRDVPLADTPLIILHTPRNVRVFAGDAVFGNIGRADSVRLGAAGCGDWTVGNTSGRLEIDIGGSGDVHAGTAGELVVRIGGSGDVTAAEVASVDASVAGSGDVWARSTGGAVRARIMGSGDVTVAGGHAPEVRADIMGSGDVSFGGEAERVEAHIMGSGDVRVKSVKGEIHKAVMGSGSVVVGDK
jgi:hypothetical protein